MGNRNKEKVGCFVPVRLTSTRLEAKQLLKIGNKFLIEHLIDGVKRSQTIDEIVLCAPNEPESLQFEEVAKNNGVRLFIYPGDGNDVVGRLTEAAQKYEADICILASGDCPLIDGLALDQLVQPLIDDPTYGKAVFAKKEGKQVLHEGIRVERRWVWERAKQLSDTPELREHQFVAVDQKPKEFADLRVCSVQAPDLYYSFEHRMSVDTPSDIKFMRQVHDLLGKEKRSFLLKEAIPLIQKQPDLLKINSLVKQKGIEDKTEYFGVIAQSESVLEKAIEFAHQMMNAHGLGVLLLVPDEGMLKKVEAEHLKGKVVCQNQMEELLDQKSSSAILPER